MSQAVDPPSVRVTPHELPASLREAGLTNWIREPLDDAVDHRRRIIVPPAVATMGTPAGTSGSPRKGSGSTVRRWRTCGGP
jgi:hypothetical protein